MTQQIDPIKLKAAAEHLEWVCQQYPDNDDVQGLYHGLQTMIEDAKAGRVLEPVADRQDVPGSHMLSDGLYQNYTNPNAGDAYVDFSIEMRGGLTDLEKSVIDMVSALKNEITAGEKS